MKTSDVSAFWSIHSTSAAHFRFTAVKCFEREQKEVPFSCFFVVSIRPAWALLVIEALSGNHNLIGFNDNGFFSKWRGLWYYNYVIQLFHLFNILVNVKCASFSTQF